MAGERAGHPLQTSALVNEAYLRLIDITQVRWQNRTHFFAMAARTMRRILVDSARCGNQRRGGDVARVSLGEAVVAAPDRQQDLVALEALAHLQTVHPRQAEVVELRLFGGLTLEETASALRMSVDAVKREWQFAKLWLLRELRGSR